MPESTLDFGDPAASNRAESLSLWRLLFNWGLGVGGDEQLKIKSKI